MGWSETVLVRAFLSLALMLAGAIGLPSHGLAQSPAAPSGIALVPPKPVPATVRVTLQTSEGVILLELEKDRAPITTRNFLRYVDEKR